MTELKQFVVYKLSIDDQFYIGSTCNFKKRLSYHKYDCFNRNTTRYNKHKKERDLRTGFRQV